MSNVFPSSEKAVSVAVSFHENTAELLKTAESLCLKTGMRLRLVNVCEPWIESVTLGFIPIPDVNLSIQLELETHARSKLRDLAANVDRSIRVETQVLSGYVAEAIIADAVVSNVAMILCGRSEPEKIYFPLGFSTAVSLMSHARVPVLVIPHYRAMDFVNRRTSFIVGDDLSQNGETVLITSVTFANALDAAVIHLHALTLTSSQMTVALNLAANTSERLSLNPDDVFSALKDRLAIKLQQRVNSLPTKLERERYSSHILEGDAAVCITKYADRLNAPQAILVFGRHHTFHFKPFGIGNVPFKAMIASKYPLLVVPT